MFKLESYLTPWLLGYLDKYVKLKPEDFQLSLWGGDAVFNNLDLRLNIVENLVNVPIKFKSGLIHELRIHIPWTRITSEPVVVTINTLEFVAKLKDQNSSQACNNSTSKNSSFANNSNSTFSDETTSPKEPPQQLPAGYIQNIINKILFNIQLIVNNVIIKFVEEDMVLSFNMKSAECFSVNSNWEKMFISEVNNSQDFHLRKILQLNDVTICLDKLESKTNSKINFYQDPLIYRFSIQSRLDFHYKPIVKTNNLNTANNFNQQLESIKLNFYCRKCDISITDQQLPMVIRLIELIVAILNGSLKLPESNDKTSESPEKEIEKSESNTSSSVKIQNESKTNEDLNKSRENLNELNDELNKNQDYQNQQGWLSWAWSYVPSVTNILPISESNSENQLEQQSPKQIEISFGFYLDEVMVNFKLFQQLNQQQHQKQSKSNNFVSFLNGQAKGLAVEIKIKKDYVHTMIGFSHVNLKSVGECCCKLSQRPSLNENILIHAGNDLELDEKIFHYLSGSLFDVLDENLDSNNSTNVGESSLTSTNTPVNPDVGILIETFDKNKNSAITNSKNVDTMINETEDRKNTDMYTSSLPNSRDKYGNLDENYGSKRFGAIFIDGLFTSANLNKTMKNKTIIEASNDMLMEKDDANDLETLNDHDQIDDVFSMSFIFYGLNINVSANFLHRAFKVFESSQKHSYTHAYAADPYEFLSQKNTNINDEMSIKLMVETLAKKFENYIPLFNETFTFKDPVIKFYPYTHNSLALNSQLDSNYNCYLNLTTKYFFVNITMPLNEILLFDVVSKLTNPSKKLIYDSYVHNHISIDTLKVSLIINEMQDTNKVFKSHEFPVLEPCFFELHFSNVIMTHKMWNNQYFPLSEFVLELPILKVNLQKHMLFIINDYVDNYLIPIINSDIFNQINRPSINKTQLKQAKLRQIIFKRLLEDLIQQHEKQQSETLSICVNDLKFKYSLTKIMHVFQLNFNMCNIYILKDENKENLVPLLETSNKIIGKTGSIKDFLVVRAQLPLKIDSNNSYIPDPLFIYANLNEINFHIRDEFISWLSYKPRGDDELLNLLILELFDDDSIELDLNESLNNKTKHSTSSLNKLEVSLDKSQSPVIYNMHAKSNKSISVSSQQSSFKNKKLFPISNKSSAKTGETIIKTKRVHHQKTISNIAVAKPTIIDTYYDFLKSLHLQISVKPATITCKSLQNGLNNELIIIVFPQIDFKSAGTKCDLEEELISSKLVEFPCSSLRACEKTSNKLPWLIELKGFQVYHYQLESNSEDEFRVSLFNNERKYFFISSSSLNSIFSVKPKYHNHNNLLSSLSTIFSIDIAKKIDVNFKKSHLNLVVSLLTILERSFRNFKQKIDYSEFDVKKNEPDFKKEETNPEFKNIDWDENKSFSQISILKEYDLSSMEDGDEEIGDFDIDLNEGIYPIDKSYVSGGELSSSSSSLVGLDSHRRKHNLTHPITGRSSPNVYIMREMNEEQVQLNFTLLLSMSSLNFNLINDCKKEIKLSAQKLSAQLELNKTFQKFIFNIKKFEITNDFILLNKEKSDSLNDSNEKIIFTSDSECMNKKLYRYRQNITSTPETKSTSAITTGSNIDQNFLELTFTRALVSNLNKKLNDLSSCESEPHSSTKIKKSKISKAKTNKWISEINLNVSDFDLILHAGKCDTFIEFIIELNKLIEQNLQTQTNDNKYFQRLNHNDTCNKKEASFLIPLIKSKEMPLLNIEIRKVRIIFPFNDENNKANDLLVAQIISLNLTSQVENPLIRNFLNNSSSMAIYNKAKSSGNLYKPGFEFEDRQYALYVKDIALFRTHQCYLSSPSSSKLFQKSIIPILDNFDLKAILGLPILFEKRLINGYTLEISIPTQNLLFYFGNLEVNLLYNIVDQNINVLKNYIKSTPDLSPTSANQKDSIKSDIKIIPLDVLLTAENINIYFYTVDNLKSNKKSSPLFWMQFIQPHSCLFMHQSLQKFEISVFDFNLKRSTPSSYMTSSNSINLEEDECILPQNSDFLMPVVETKPGEPNPKTGVLNGVFSMKLNNFLNIFSTNSAKIEKKDETNNENKNEKLICVCNECLRCYEFTSLKNNSNQKSSKLYQNNSDLFNNLLSTQILIERPLRFKGNLIFFSQVKQFIDNLEFLTKDNSTSSDMQNSPNITGRSVQSVGSNNKLEFLFDLNLHFSTSQIVLGLELDYKNLQNSNAQEMFNTNILYVSFSSLNVCINKIKNHDLRHMSDDYRNNLVIRQNFLEENSNFVNHANLHISDFQSKIQLISDENKNFKENLHFLGPSSLKASAVYCMDKNELYSTINLGSVNVSFNKKLLDFFINLCSFFIYKDNNNNDEISLPKKQNEFSLVFVKHEDDLRNGSFDYTIIDDNFVKSSLNDNNNNLWLMSHVRLPNEEEIICVDDMDSHMLRSTISWRYTTRRALINLKIQPLPFVGSNFELPNSNVENSDSSKLSLKCYIEYLNECTQQFNILKEFNIEEGCYTNVICVPPEIENFESLIFAKVWRIRLSNEAKRFIYASSLLASCVVDSVEFNQQSLLKNFLSHAHVEFTCESLELKLNTVNLADLSMMKSADLISINLTEFALKFLLNKCKNSSELILSNLVTTFYGQLSVDYCEYRFLTMRPLIDSFQFKITSSISLHPEFNNPNVSIFFDLSTVNLLASQSAFIALKQLENEWKTNNDTSPHFYMIQNDTDMPLNIKQFDTEETCLIKSGKTLPYTWRTHKKAQLLQLYLPKYRLISKPFQINDDGMQEIIFNFSQDEACFLTLLVNVESKTSLLSAIHKNSDSSFKKIVYIQSKLVICNYLNVALETFHLNYSCNNKFFELHLNHPINHLSRSSSTYEIIQSNNSTVFNINSLRVNNIELLTEKDDSNNTRLKNGIICKDYKLNLTYWMNLYEQPFKLKDENNFLIQYNIVLTPIFIFCSYLPYELSTEILKNNSKSFLIKSHSMSYLTSLNENSNEITIKFEQVLNKNDQVQNLNTIDIDFNSKHWTENRAITLSKNDFNISCCDNRKLLLYANLFKYVTVNTNNDQNTDIFNLNILTSNMTEAAKLGGTIQESSSNEKIVSIGDESQLSEFEIIKKTCWPFSKTIRIDLKPICLLVNKTCYSLRMTEKFAETELVYVVDSNGQLCMPNMSNSLNEKNEEIFHKKYKFSIILDEYSVLSERIVSTNNEVDLKKNTIEYESEWVEISNEQVTPFYREKQQYKLNRLYLNNCWLDLKLYPKTNMRNIAKFKLIYLVLQSAEILSNDNEVNTEKTTNTEKEKNLEPVTRVLTIQSKFLFNNKTKLDLKLQVEDDFLINKTLTKRFIESSTDDEDHLIKSFSLHSTGNVINKSNFYLKHEKEKEINESNLDEDEIDQQNINDLFYLRIITANKNRVKQSKPLILTIKEKAIKQIVSNGQIDDNLLISRQCFCLYFPMTNESESFIIAQKLLVEKSGRLIIKIHYDSNYLVNLFNKLDVDIYVWPRLSTNFIFENYVKNVNSFNEKLFTEYKTRKMLNMTSAEKKHMRTKSISKQKPLTLNSFYDKSLSYMHFVPAKSSLKFNYDFVGTNLFPIENLKEQIFFMIGLANNKNPKLSNFEFNGKPFELSPNLCRLYDTNFEITFEVKNSMKLFYLGNTSETLNQVNINRYVTYETSEEFFRKSSKEPKFIEKFKLNLNIERLTLAFNDDYMSQIYQTEIIRLTCDYLNLNLKQLKLNQIDDDCSLIDHQLDKKIQINFNCMHFQLDNQMFDLDLDEKFSSQKYDFPVIIIPRDTKNCFREPQNISKNINYFKSFDSFHYFEHREANRKNELKFFDTNLLFICNKGSNSLRLIDVDINLAPLDIYLEDYLVYNLIKIGMSYIEIVSISEPSDVKNKISFDNEDENLDVIVFPLILLRQINISNIDALVSLQTSIKIYLATHKMPIIFESFKISGLPLALMSSPQLIKLFASHYLTLLLFRAGWLLGSLDLIGTPTAFVQQVSNGIYDFLKMPYHGLKNNGPSGLLHGFSSGSLSLIRNLSAGTITSMTSFAAFISRNMDILSCDQFHMARQDQLRHHAPESSFGSGLLQVSSSFIITIMGAIGGLAEQPLQSMHTSDSLLKGVSKGIIGLVTKPVGAVAELFNQTGQGLLKITGGTNRVPLSELRLQRRALNKEFSRFSISFTKCLWKLISTGDSQSSNSTHINFIIDAVYTIDENSKSKSETSNTYNLTGCYLILTDEILHIIDKNDDMLLRAFYLSQIDIDIKKNSSNSANKNSSVLVVTLNNQSVENYLNEYQKAYENSFDRVVDYLVDANKITNESQLKRSNSEVSKSNNQIIVMPEYYKFSKLNLNNYLNTYDELPCACGSMIYTLNKAGIITSKSNKSNTIKSTSSEFILGNENISSKHVRQPSNCSEMPRIHRLKSSASIASTNSLLSVKNTFDFNQIEKQQQQQFFYYVDPRFSSSFISIFNSIKRKITNKGFQF